VSRVGRSRSQVDFCACGTARCFRSSPFARVRELASGRARPGSAGSTRRRSPPSWGRGSAMRGMRRSGAALARRPGARNAFDARAAQRIADGLVGSIVHWSLPCTSAGASMMVSPAARQSGSSDSARQYSALGCLPQPATAAASTATQITTHSPLGSRGTHAATSRNPRWGEHAESSQTIAGGSNFGSSRRIRMCADRGDRRPRTCLVPQDGAPDRQDRRRPR